MLDFLKSILIVEFTGMGKRRADFFTYQSLIIFSIISLISIIFTLDLSLRILGFQYCLYGEYCLKEEIELGKIIEIVKNIIFIMILLFIFRFNGCNVLRFSFLKLTPFFTKIFQIIFSILKIFILSFIIFYLLNFILFFYGQNYYYFSDTFNQAKNFLSFFPVLYIVFLMEILLFILGLILSKPKNKHFIAK